MYKEKKFCNLKVRDFATGLTGPKSFGDFRETGPVPEKTCKDAPFLVPIQSARRIEINLSSESNEKSKNSLNLE